MASSDDKSCKIFFRFYSDLLEEWTVETLWAEVIDEEKRLYKLDSIPFYAAIASDDIIFAEFDAEEQMLTYRATIEYSGNSTIQVVLLDKTVLTNEIRDIFNSFGCVSEKYKEGYFVIEVPANKEYKIIKDKLTTLQEEGIIDYAEPYLSDKHAY